MRPPDIEYKLRILEKHQDSMIERIHKVEQDVRRLEGLYGPLAEKFLPELGSKESLHLEKECKHKNYQIGSADKYWKCSDCGELIKPSSEILEVRMFDETKGFTIDECRYFAKIAEEHYAKVAEKNLANGIAYGKQQAIAELREKFENAVRYCQFALNRERSSWNYDDVVYIEKALFSQEKQSEGK